MLESSGPKAKHFLMLLRQHFLFHFVLTCSLFVFSSRVSRSCGESSSSLMLPMLLGHVASNMLPAHRWLVSWRFAHFGLSFLSFWHLRRRELGLNCYQTLNDLQLSIELLPDKSCRRLPLATADNANGILKTNNTTIITRPTTPTG